MSTNRMVPKRRFEDYKAGWEPVVLGEITEITMGHSPKSSSYTSEQSAHILVQGNADIKKNRVVPRIWTTEITKEADKNDIIFTVRAPVGEVAKTDYNIVIGRGVAAIKGNDFILQYLLKMKLDNYWNKLSSGSTFDSINSDELYSIGLWSPSVEEQLKIGKFFKVLDERIANQERKIAKVKALKEAYLTEMFPQEGETVPKQRFKGFEGNWYIKKISQMFNITRGNVLATTKISKVKTDQYCYPVYSSQTRRNGLLGYYSKYLYDTAITWTTDGANAGTVNYREGKFYSTNVNGVLLSNDGFSCKAIAESLNLITWKHVSKVGNPKLMNNVMSDIEIKVPKSITELNYISNFFKNLDVQIQTEESKLEKLKKTKEAYLEEMFV